MRRVLVALALLAFVHATPAREIDAASSTAEFSISHIWVENVTGRVPILRGAVVLAAGSTIPASVTAELDATRIATGEPDRDAALRSPDFFDTRRFPTWTFRSTRIVPQGAGAFEMFGDLTLHGVTQPERVDVTVSGDAANPIYRASAQIDRHAFGMAVTTLDPAIGGTAQVTLVIHLI